MSVIHVILSIIYVILGVAISMVILMQEGKSNGLGAQLAESPQTVTGVRTEAVPWKARWKHFTRYGAIAFMLITIIPEHALLRIGG